MNAPVKNTIAGAFSAQLLATRKLKVPKKNVMALPLLVKMVVATCPKLTLAKAKPQLIMTLVNGNTLPKVHVLRCQSPMRMAMSALVSAKKKPRPPKPLWKHNCF